MDGFSEAGVRVPDNHTARCLAAAEGTCVSSDCRQLTVSLTSVFSKLYVINETGKDDRVISLSHRQITAEIVLLLALFVD